MRKLFYVLFLLCLASPALAQVPCVAVSVSGSGSANGLSWTNAQAAFPTFVRGTRYYLADGTGYPAIDFTAAVSGISTIELRKAQAYDYGRTSDGCSNDISSGWNASTMGSAQAIWSGTSTYFGHFFYITTGYFVLNGNGQQTAQGCGGSVGSSPTGTLTTPTDCGIKIDDTANCGTDALWFAGGSTTGTTVKYLDYLGCGNASTEDYAIRADNSTSSSITHMFLRNFGSVCVIVGGTSGFTFDDNYLFRNQITAGGNPTHGQCLQSFGDSGNMDVSRNVFRDLGGTAIMMSWVGTGSVQAGPYNFYDNVIWNTPGFTPLYPSANGLLACINGFTCNNVTMSQNTVGLMPSGALVAIDSETGGTYTVQNNIWYQSSNNANPSPHGTFTQDHNSYLASGSSCPSGTANVCNNTAADPFNSPTTGDFTLSADGSNVNNRAALGSPYNIDAAGNTFTTDRGAYQSTVAGTPTPAPALGMFAWDWDYLLPDPNLNFGRCQRDFGGENPMRIRLTALRSF